MRDSARLAFGRAGLTITERAAPSITWHSFDLKTGRRGPELITKDGDSFGRIIGESTDLSGLGVMCYDAELETSTDGTPTSAGAVPDWDASTLPGRVMLVAINELGLPMWGGMVTRRRSAKDGWVQVDLVTLEAYFDRRFTKDHTFTATAQGAIVSAILTSDVITDGVQFVIDADSSFVRDRTYLDDEDKTVLSVLQELMKVEGGPEFTVDLEWANADQTMLARIVRVRDRIGTAQAQPVARFELPGSIVDFDYTEDYGSDNGANDVMATSSGEGDTRPESDHAVATDLLAAGWAKFERRFEPSTSITEVETLNNHAQSELAEMRAGLNELALTVRLDVGPRVNEDFFLGDDVTTVLTCPRFPEQVGPDGDRVAGYTKNNRCIGWDVDYGARTLVPKLVEVED